MSWCLNQLYNDTQHVLKERHGDVSREDVRKSLQDAMNFLFQPEDSGFEDRTGRCNIFMLILMETVWMDLGRTFIITRWGKI